MGRSNENVRAREKEKREYGKWRKKAGGCRGAALVMLFNTKAQRAPPTLKVFACKNVILLILRILCVCVSKIIFNSLSPNE